DVHAVQPSLGEHLRHHVLSQLTQIQRQRLAEVRIQRNDVVEPPLRGARSLAGLGLHRRSLASGCRRRRSHHHLATSTECRLVDGRAGEVPNRIIPPARYVPSFSPPHFFSSPVEGILFSKDDEGLRARTFSQGPRKERPSKAGRWVRFESWSFVTRV